MGLYLYYSSGVQCSATFILGFMDAFKFWKKLNAVVKTRTPMDSARKMVDNGEITKDEISWALTALATLPMAMIDTLKDRCKLQ